MKFVPVVEEMAEMSPMCSIMAAMAMGAITRMAVRSNLAMYELLQAHDAGLVHGGEVDEGA